MGRKRKAAPAAVTSTKAALVITVSGIGLTLEPLVGFAYGNP